jgi:hypothetical protein
MSFAMLDVASIQNIVCLRPFKPMVFRQKTFMSYMLNPYSDLAHGSRDDKKRGK